MDEAKLQKQIEKDSINYLYENLKSSIFGAIVGAVLITISYTILGTPMLPYIYTWLGIFALVTVYRILDMRKFQKYGCSDTAKCKTVFSIATLTHGILWGISTVFIYFVGPPYAVVHLITLVAIVSGGMNSLSSNLKLSLYYLATVLIPTIIALLMMSKTTSVLLAIVLVIFLIFLLRYAKMLSQTIRTLSREKYIHNQARIDLEQSQKNYKTIFEGVQTGVFTYDKNLIIKEINSVAIDIFTSDKKLIKDYDLTRHNTAKLSPALLEALNDKRGYFEGKITAISRDRDIFVSLKTSPMYSNKQEIIGGIGIINDIGTQKKLELGLIEAKRAAEIMSKSKSDFVANMSHELRTPLNAIIGLSNLAIEDDDIVEIKSLLRKILNSSNILTQIINDTLDFSKLEAGQLKIVNAMVNLEQLLAQLKDVFEMNAKSKGITFKIITNGHIPKYIKMDEIRLKQILMNLLGNAIKFTKVGEVTLTLTPTQQDEKLKIKFEISDTGIGIKEADIDKLFSPFIQADVTTTREFGGTGLGLSISQKLATLMGTTIKVTSVFNEGSKFFFELETEEVKNVVSDNKIKYFENLNEKNYKLLVAEDNEINQEVIERVLKKLGFEVDIANNGREVVKMVNENQYDLVLMDVQMPVMDGITATKEIKADPKFANLPIIALTAISSPDELQPCFDAGMVDHISKPIVLQKLKAILKKYLN